MKFLKPTVALLSILCVSGVLVTSVFAVAFPNLPAGLVTINNTNLTAYDYPFVSVLSGVPPGYDVSNGVYTGWCVDLIGHAIRGSTYQVHLLSSLSASLPTPFNTIPWDKINYILNNKQGTGVDISQAIWFFVNGGVWPNAAQLPGYPFPLPPSTLAQAMVNEANAHGSGFVPGPGQIVAVICAPPDEAVQDTIIELRIPGTGPGLTPGFWKHNVGVYLTAQGYDDVHVNGAYSDPTGSTVVTKDTMATFLSAWTNAELYDLWLDMNTIGGGAAGAATRNNAANVFNAAAGLSPL
jgi:hypothetical protein